MSKPSKKKAKKLSRRENSKFASHNISMLQQHKQIGSKLIPPLLQIPNATPSSWMDHHMPEMLWAVLLAGTLAREDYLECFRQLAPICREWFIKKDKTSEDEKKQDLGGVPTFNVIVDQTKLAEVSDDQFKNFLSILLAHPKGYEALRPLLLIDCLPGYERWCRELSVEKCNDDWSVLAQSVAGVLDHQSEAATDIRWFKLIIPIISGRMRLPESLGERVDELRLFPNKGDMRMVRPFIRSGEMAFRRNPPSEWIESFWSLTLAKTNCIDPSSVEDYTFSESEISPNSLYLTRDEVVRLFSSSAAPSRVDARLDTAFGLVLYALSLLEEIGMHRIHTRISGVLTLRSLVEVCITLRYLVHIDKPAMWQSYRVYGSGQAKLAFLKLQQSTGDLPSFVDEEAMHSIANEDTWQEFLNIDVGHWANSNLRKLAAEIGAKDVYDKYFDWSSGFIHANWAAVRDTNFITCHNSLHRLHRIPRMAHRSLPSVESDCVLLVNETLLALERIYPSAKSIPRISLLSRGQG